jgi:serine protease Do
MHRTRCVLLGLALAGVATAQSKPPGPPSPATPRAEVPAGTAAFDAQALYDRAVRSCVYLVAPLKGGMADGVGVLIDADRRLVLTTAGAVADADRVFAQFPARDRRGAVVTDRKTYIDRIVAREAIKGKVLHVDAAAGLAVVRLDTVPPDTPAVPLASESAETGAPVLGIGGGGAGNPFVSKAGKLRALGTIPLGSEEPPSTFQSPSPGCPVIDARGQLVGMTQVKRPELVLDIKEVRAFLAEKKVAIPEPPGRPRPKE